MNESSSGTYEQLFPRQETGQDNRIDASQEYRIPATSAAFRIAGPAGYETVYWLVTPGRVNDAAARYQPPPASKAAPPASKAAPPALIPRCDDAILKSRGDCVDSR